MNKIWFTSDTHFGHDTLIREGFRKIPGVRSTDEHDDLLIRRWNARVGKNDHVYHLGDFSWHAMARYRAVLKGRIHLILGNHDRLKKGDAELFESISQIKSIKIDGQYIFMCHYAMRVWNKSHHGSWHLYGHSHGRLPDDPNSRSFDVGVDCHDFQPLEFKEVADIMKRKKQEPVDHHGRKEIP